MRTYIAVVAFLLSGSSLAFTFDSGVASRATHPNRSVNGRIFYAHFGAPLPARPLAAKHCVLFHGHGVSQSVLDLIFARFEGKGLTAGFGAGMPLPAAFLPEGMAVRLDRLQQLSSVSAFANIYFGEQFIQKLLAGACTDVWVPVQESIQSSILEMTIRAERFVREVACRDGNCLLLGHSKAGAAVTALARRCMQATSDLGEAGCGRLREIYSASGAIEGGALPLLLLGAKQVAANQAQLDKVTFGFFSSSKVLEDGMKRLHQIESVGEKLHIDLTGEKQPHTNPLWFDLGPMAAMENDEPIGLIHGSQFALKREGWLTQVEYSASGTAFRFDKVKYAAYDDPQGVKKYKLEDPQAAFVRMGTLPVIEPRPQLLAPGQRLGARFSGEKLRLILDFLWEPFLQSQQLVDSVARTAFADLHGDPQSRAAFELGKIEAGRRWPELAAELNRWAYLPSGQPGQQIALKESDGLVELGSALGVCQRSLSVAPEVRVAVDCHAFSDLHHMGVTGVSRESEDKILKAFSSHQERRAF